MMTTTNQQAADTMSSLEIRLSMNEMIDAYWLSQGDARKANAKLIANAMRAYPWLADQVPYEIQNKVFKLAREV
jgi:hypothetical protein